MRFLCRLTSLWRADPYLPFGEGSWKQKISRKIQTTLDSLGARKRTSRKEKKRGWGIVCVSMCAQIHTSFDPELVSSGAFSVVGSTSSADRSNSITWKSNHRSRQSSSIPTETWPRPICQVGPWHGEPGDKGGNGDGSQESQRNARIDGTCTWLSTCQPP